MQPLSKRFFTLSLTLAILLVPFAAFMERWNLYDAWRLHGYTPPAPVAQLAADTALTDTGRRLFYVNHPDLEDKDTFRQQCATAEQTIVLGCFIAYKGIYLQNITDPRLTGVQQVTAAHEMLHAAYERLSPSEKTRIGKLLNDKLASLDNARIKSTIDDYKKNGADVTNELHSILPTEVRDLPPELETYYKQYFSDRQKVVGFSEQYEAAFTSRKQQVAAYDQQLAEIKKDIDVSNAALDGRQQAINAKQKELDSLLASNRTSEYNAAVPGYNAMVQDFNNQVNRVRGLIDTYNSIVKKRNDIAAEEGELVKAIDTRPSTVPAQ